MRANVHEKIKLKQGHSKIACNASHLQHVQRLLASNDTADEYDDQSCTVYRQLELEELADVIKNSAAPEHSFDDGREVVIEDDDVCSFLGNLSAFSESTIIIL